MSKTKSPPAPNFALNTAFEEVKKIYQQFSRASLTEDDIASALGHTTTASGSFKKKRFTLCEYGLLEEEGDKYLVSTAYLDLRDHRQDPVRFQATAFKLITNVKVFGDLLEDLHDRIPTVDTLTSRLERQGFNRDRAADVAGTFRESLEFAQVLGADNRLHHPGEVAEGGSPDDAADEEDDREPDTSSGKKAPELVVGNLTIEIAASTGGKVVVSYPPDLTASDASKVGEVLKALAN